MAKRLGGSVSETTVKIYQTGWLYILVVRNFIVRLLDNFKSHTIFVTVRINIVAQDGVTQWSCSVPEHQTDAQIICVISSFRRDVGEMCALSWIITQRVIVVHY
jgi:hypothetical protein